MPPELLMGGSPYTIDDVHGCADQRFPEIEEDSTRFVVRAFINRVNYIKDRQIIKTRLLFLGIGVVIGVLVASGICNLVN